MRISKCSEKTGAKFGEKGYTSVVHISSIVTEVSRTIQFFLRKNFFTQKHIKNTK